MSVEISKVKATLEDIEFGLGEVIQTRFGKSYTLHQINATHIPYLEGESVYDRLELLSDTTTGASASAALAALSAAEAAGYASAASTYRTQAGNSATSAGNSALAAAGYAQTAGDYKNLALQYVQAAEAAAGTAATDAANLAIAQIEADIADELLAIEASTAMVLAATGIDIASFTVVDGELNIGYYDPADVTPSIVDGEFILTY